MKALSPDPLKWLRKTCPRSGGTGSTLETHRRLRREVETPLLPEDALKETLNPEPKLVMNRGRFLRQRHPLAFEFFFFRRSRREGRSVGPGEAVL